jgi:hypothetical protein
MSVTSGDIVFYGSTYMSETDATPQGSGIDLTTKVVFDSSTLANAPAGPVGVVSSLTTDTGIYLDVFGRNTAGSIISGTVEITGNVVASGATSFERIMQMQVRPGHSGTITVQDQYAVVIATMASGINQIRRPFYNVASDVEGGSVRYFYEKIFAKNNNDTYSLLSPVISEVAGGIAGSIDFDLEKYCTDNASYGANTSTNRLTAPDASGMQAGTFDSNSKYLLQDTDLRPSGAIGVWLKLTLGAGVAPSKSTYTMSVSGNTI